MAYRPPYGYNPGGGHQPGHQQQPIPGHMMQTPQAYPGMGMVPQGYQIPGQPGMVLAPGMASGMAPRMNPGMPQGMYYPSQQAMMQQGFVPPGMMVAGGAVPPQRQQASQQPPRPLTEEERRLEEKMKKERYFQEQKMKLKQFGKGSKPGLSLDMANSLVDSLGGPSKGNGQGKPTQPQPHQPPKAAEVESFGDFQHATGGTSATQGAEEEDDFGDFLQARSNVPTSAPVTTTETIVPSGNPAPEVQNPTPQPASTPQQGETPAPPAKDPLLPKKEEISLEAMMQMSTDLSEATKQAKPIHVKKTLKEVKPHQPASTKSAVFAASDKSRTWVGGDNFSTLFTMEKKEAVVSQAPAHLEGTESMPGKGVPASQSPMPAWSSDPSRLPLVYRQVYQATFVNGVIQTEALYPILLMSGLERPVLGQIWNMVNRTQSGVLQQQELFCALALIALHQNHLPVSMESLMTLKEAPVPVLTPSQQAAHPNNAPTATAPSQTPATSVNLTGPSAPNTFPDPASDAVISFSQSVAKEKETFNSQFDREEENCYIFTTSPTASSSGHSSPVLWDQNSIYDKLRSQSQESLSSSSVNSDHMGDEQIPISQFKSHQPEPQPKNSLEEEFAEFQSSRNVEAPAQPTPFNILPAPPGGPIQFKTVTMAPKPTKSATSPNLKSLSDNGPDVDLEFGDFSSHRAVQPSVPNAQPSFGGTSAMPGGPTEEWASFQHASSEPSLMSADADDKYAAFKVLAPPQSDDSLFGTTSLSPTPQPAAAADSDDDCGSALRGMVSESSDEEPFANFQSASIPPEIFQQGLNSPPGSVGGGLLDSPVVNPGDEFGDFIAPQESNAGKPVGDDIFGDFSKPESGSGTNLPSGSFPPPKQDSMSSVLPPPPGDLGSTNLASFQLKTLGSTSGDALGLPSTELGPKTLNLGPPPQLAGKGPGINSGASAGLGDRYGAFKDFQLTGGDDAHEEDDFGDFHVVEAPQGSGDSLSFDDKLPGERSSQNTVPNFMDNSVNGLDFQNNNDDVMKPPPLHPGLDGPPLLLPDTLGGDRYSEVAGDKLDDNRHISAWERCLKSCHSTIKVANDVLNNISSSSVCKEVTSSSSGSEYFKAIIEVYRVARRVFASIKARGLETDGLTKLIDDIEKTWTNLAAFLSATSLQIDNGSFVFKTATLKPEPENQDKACGVCLLNVDARSKAYNRTEDFHKLNYGGRQYHATCANLWVNMVDSLLPALPLEALL